VGVVSTRVGAALALLVSIAAFALATVAFMSTVRDDSPTRGRLVPTRVNSDSTDLPQAFPLDDFVLGRDSDGDFHAFYVYPPGYFGHVRGCRVVWDPDAVIDGPRGRAGPGLYLEPCGGAHFDRDGALVSGPADRGLDEFEVEPGVDGVIVDTRRLLCGRAFVPPTTTPTVTSETATPTPSGRERCERVTPDTP